MAISPKDDSYPDEMEQDPLTSAITKGVEQTHQEKESGDQKGQNEDGSKQTGPPGDKGQTKEPANAGSGDDTSGPTSESASGSMFPPIGDTRGATSFIAFDRNQKPAYYVLGDRVITPQQYDQYVKIRTDAEKENQEPDYSQFADEWTPEDMDRVTALRRDPQYAKYFPEEVEKTRTERAKEIGATVLETFCGLDSDEVSRQAGRAFNNMRRGISGLLNGDLLGAVSSTIDASFNSLSILGAGVDSFKETIKRRYGFSAGEVIGEGLKQMVCKKEIADTKKAMDKEIAHLQKICLNTFGYANNAELFLKNANPVTNPDEFEEYMKQRGYTEEQIKGVQDLINIAPTKYIPGKGIVPVQVFNDEERAHLAYMLLTGDYDEAPEVIRKGLSQLYAIPVQQSPQDAQEPQPLSADEYLAAQTRFGAFVKPVTVQDLRKYYLTLEEKKAELESELEDGERGYSYVRDENGQIMRDEEGYVCTENVDRLSARSQRQLKERIRFYSQALNGMRQNSPGLFKDEIALTTGRINTATYEARKAREQNEKAYTDGSDAYRYFAGKKDGVVELVPIEGISIPLNVKDRFNVSRIDRIYDRLHELKSGTDWAAITGYFNGVVPEDDPTVQSYISYYNAYACMDAYRAYARQMTLIEGQNGPDADLKKEQAYKALEEICKAHPWRGGRLTYAEYTPVNMAQWAQDNLGIAYTDNTWDSSLEHMFPGAGLKGYVTEGVGGVPSFQGLDNSGSFNLTGAANCDRLHGIVGYYSELEGKVLAKKSLTSREKSDLRKLRIFRAYQLRAEAINDLVDKITGSQGFKDRYSRKARGRIKEKIASQLWAYYGTPSGDEWDWKSENEDFWATPSDASASLENHLGDWSTWTKDDAFERASTALAGKIDLNDLDPVGEAYRKSPTEKKSRTKSEVPLVKGGARPIELTQDTLEEYLDNLAKTVNATELDKAVKAGEAILADPECRDRLNKILSSGMLPDAELRNAEDIPGYLGQISKDIGLLMDLKYLSASREPLLTNIKNKVFAEYVKTLKRAVDEGRIAELFNDLHRSEMEITLGGGVKTTLGKVFQDYFMEEVNSELNQKNINSEEGWMGRAEYAATKAIGHAVENALQIPIRVAHKTKGEKKQAELLERGKDSIVEGDADMISFLLEDLEPENGTPLSWTVMDETGMIMPRARNGTIYNTKLDDSKPLFNSVFRTLIQARDKIEDTPEGRILKAKVTAYLDTVKAYCIWREYMGKGQHTFVPQDKDALKKVYQKRLAELTGADGSGSLFDPADPAKLLSREYEAYHTELGLMIDKYDRSKWLEECQKYRQSLPINEQYNRAQIAGEEAQQWGQAAGFKGKYADFLKQYRKGIWDRYNDYDPTQSPSSKFSGGDIEAYVKGEIKHLVTKAIIENTDYPKLGELVDGNINPWKDIIDKKTCSVKPEYSEYAPSEEMLLKTLESDEDIFGQLKGCSWDDWKVIDKAISELPLQDEFRNILWARCGLSGVPLIRTTGEVLTSADPPRPNQLGTIIGFTQEDVLDYLKNKFNSSQYIPEKEAKLASAEKKSIEAFVKAGQNSGLTKDQPTQMYYQDIATLATLAGELDPTEVTQSLLDEITGSDGGVHINRSELVDWSKKMSAWINSSTKMIPSNYLIGTGIASTGLSLAECLDRMGIIPRGVAPNSTVKESGVDTYMQVINSDDEARTNANSAALMGCYFPIQELAKLSAKGKDTVELVKKLESGLTPDAIKGLGKFVKDHPIMWFIVAGYEPDMPDDTDDPEAIATAQALEKTKRRYWYDWGSKIFFGDGYLAENTGWSEEVGEELRKTCECLDDGYLHMYTYDQRSEYWGYPTEENPEEYTNADMKNLHIILDQLIALYDALPNQDENA